MKGMHIQIIQPYHGIPAGGEQGTMARKLGNLQRAKSTRCAFRPRTSSFCLPSAKGYGNRNWQHILWGSWQIFPHQLLCFMFFCRSSRGGVLQHFRTRGFLAGKASETTRSSWVQRLCSCFLVVEQLWKVAETAGTAADQKKHQLEFGWHLHAFTCIYYMKPGYDRYDGIWKQLNRTSRCRQQNMRISSRSQGAMNFESTSCEWVRRNTKCREICQSPWTGSRPRMGCLNYWSPSLPVQDLEFLMDSESPIFETTPSKFTNLHSYPQNPQSSDFCWLKGWNPVLLVEVPSC